MILKFITGNKNKAREMAEILDGIEVQQVDIELDEIQSLDPHEVIKHKLDQAHQQLESSQVSFDGIIVDDTSMYFEALDNKLPGPFVKAFLETLGPGGIAKFTRQLGKPKTSYISSIGYMSAQGQMKFFESRGTGLIVEPRGDKSFGFDEIYQPDGYEKTYAEMDSQEKHAISMRGQAGGKLKKFLLNNKA